MANNRSLDASNAQTDSPNALPEASNTPSSASTTAQTDEPVPAEEVAPLEATAAVHEQRTVPSAEITKIDILVRGTRTLVNDDFKLLGVSASWDEATADELQLKKALIIFHATAAPNNATPNESRGRGKSAAPGHTSVRDESKSSPECDSRNLTYTVTNEPCDCTGLTAVNTNDFSHSAGLTAVDSTMRNPPGAGNGDVAQSNNAEAVAALTTNWGG
jgi:hypothetical protein